MAKEASTATVTGTVLGRDAEVNRGEERGDFVVRMGWGPGEAR